MRKFPFPRFSVERAGVSWIVVFLGNPGRKYAGTRHNAGFMAAEKAESATRARIDRVKFRSVTAIASMGGERVLLQKPHTFMNLSGSAVWEAMCFYKIPLGHVVAVSDDIALPVGALRIRGSGSSGGHNGLKDIIAKCGGEAFPRVRIGVGAPPANGADVLDWVLSRFSDADIKILDAVFERAVSAVGTIITSGVERAMNEFNTRGD
ncbi:MAG: aminoacyl-tRNA hydrolase [Oscillospiraceae bacterium]|jgi:PTH1 family peptidyl-tRNA hydrolase|nr:aminoacyl-tRNA hydrolase [Oscillospiraceae bacterium]